MSFGDYDKRTPLHLAAAEGYAEVVKFLITECKVDAEVEDRYSCLMTITHSRLIASCLTPFPTLFQLDRGNRCIYPCFPGVVCIRALHIILSKSKAAFPYHHRLNNR